MVNSSSLVLGCLSIISFSFIESSNFLDSFLSNLTKRIRKFSFDLGIGSDDANGEKVSTTSPNQMDEEEDHALEPNQKLFKILNDSLLNFPKVLIDMIVEYIPNNYPMEMLTRVARKLKIPLRKLNFYSMNFLKELVPLIKNEKSKFSSENLFWKDLGMLIFKHLFYMKQENVINTDDENKIVTENIQNIFSIVPKCYFLGIECNFDFKTMSNESFDGGLLKSEFFEESKYLSNQFTNALEYFYISPIFDIFENEERERRKEIKKITCEDFKEKFFENGNPDSNLLLKYFMIYDDHKKGFIKNCLEKNVQPNHSSIRTNLIEEIDNKINRLKSKGIEYSVKIGNLKYATTSIMKSILSRNEKFNINNGSDLYKLLQRMNDANLLEKENIEAIIEFEELDSDDDEYEGTKWKVESFKYYLYQYKSQNSPTKTELELVRKCLKIFRKSKRDSKAISQS